MRIDFRTDALFSVNLGRNPLLVNRQMKETIRSELFNTYKEHTGLDAYDIQEISPVEYEKLRENGMEELSNGEYNN